MVVTSRFFCFSHPYPGGTDLKKILSCKLDKFTLFIQLKLGKSFQTCCVNFFCLMNGKPLFCKTRTDYMSKTLCTRLRNWWEFISLLISAITKSFMFFLGKLIYKSNRKLFSCICIAWYKHSRGWEKSRPFCKPSTLSRVCVTVLNSPNPSRVSIRLCKHRKCFLLLKWF